MKLLIPLNLYELNLQHLQYSTGDVSQDHSKGLKTGDERQETGDLRQEDSRRETGEERQEKGNNRR